MKIGLVPLAAKPFHEGHNRLIEIAAEENDSVLLFVSDGDRIRPDEFPIKGNDMVKVWHEILKNLLPENVELVFTSNPVTEVYKKLEQLNDSKSLDKINIYSDEEDVAKNYPDKRINKYDINIKRRGISRKETVDVSGTDMRQFLDKGDKKSFFKYAPSSLTDKEKQKYFSILKQEPLAETLLQHIRKVIKEDKANTHITHVEDLLIDDGTMGGKKAVASLKKIIEDMENKRGDISIKIDGSPSIIFGVNPDNGKFFVSTKSLFNKQPKIAYSEQDVRDLFGDKPDLVNKLTAAFKHLSQLKFSGILQGDILFTKDALQVKNIQGKQYVTFTPNVITYAIKTDNDLAKQITRSELGLALHTSYSGDSMTSLQSKPLNQSPLPSTSSVWVMPVNYKVDKNIKTDDILKDLDEYNKIIKDIKLKQLPTNISSMFNIFVNKLVRESNTSVLNDTTVVLSAFKHFIASYMQKKADELKKPESKKARNDEADSMIKFIEGNKNDFVTYMSVYNGLRTIKNKLIKRMDEAETDIETFVNSKSGFRKTSQEGFVMSDDDVNVKLVNRDEFSKLNFEQSKNI